jgi:hypothetical protein
MNAQSSIQQAKAIASRGDTKTAIAILRDLVRQNPRDVDAWLALADIVDNPQQARQCLERVLKIDPINPIAQQKLYGEQLNELGFPSKIADEPVQGEASALDFSNLYTQEDQASQSRLAQNQLQRSYQEQSQPRDQSIPVMPSPALSVTERRQEPPPVRRPAAKKPVQGKKKGLSKTEIILIGAIGFMCVCLTFLGFAYIGNSGVLEQEPTDLPEVVTAVIYENIRASNASDFDGYMGTIHSDSPVYNSTKEGIRQAFSDEFTLSYRVSDVYVIEQNRNKAVVHFVLTTKLVRGPISFRDNRITGEMTLRKENGAWKIYNQKVDNVEYLN